MTTRTRGAAILLAIVAIGGIAILIKPSIAYPLLPKGKQRTFSQQQARLTVSMTYPEFGRPGVDSAISAVRQDLVDTAVLGTEEHADAGGENMLNVSYVVPWRSLRYASVIFTVTVQGPAFHGMEYVIARTYDLFDDRALTLTDLSASDGVAIAAIAVREQLRTVSGVEPDLMQRGLAAPASFSEFILQDKDVVFFMNPGQVAPPEKGVIAVVVPRAAFASHQ